ncbi:hypothetical protein LIER_21170 [Lithospermum erythrorhizon]|uniref:Uncharacterized protein n=1 Tax=Lithospermum erythrorhizon TaxID=34254 RepID=A0AAV3QRQ4_LITER
MLCTLVLTLSRCSLRSLRAEWEEVSALYKPSLGNRLGQSTQVPRMSGLSTAQCDRLKFLLDNSNWVSDNSLKPSLGSSISQLEQLNALLSSFNIHSNNRLSGPFFENPDWSR